MKRFAAAEGAFRHPIEVMHVIGSLQVGGPKTVLSRLVAGDQDWTVAHSVVTLKPGGTLRADLEAAGIPVLDLGMLGKPSAFNALVRLIRVIRSRRPNVLNSWLYHADLLATVALVLSGRRSSTRLVWGIRCSDMDMSHYARSNRYILRALAALSSKTDLALCNSNAGRVAPRTSRLSSAGMAGHPERPRRGPLRAHTGRAYGRPIRDRAGRNELRGWNVRPRRSERKDHATFVRAATISPRMHPKRGSY